ncbi:pyridoxal phosphate-dependent aminotransferase [Nocardia stercoris]|uniref:Aminotransferase class I/II-fold pyridoxal phosphate-dependent enzyme n=1 Tax=Nocardia stercoris TaxID=2483361 RepID=A0A3M2L388_9NOCA|nr:aminotransferase class I/II-fold pyridoxal phosphate-dependent enzyme [Nocardia stercoris]RMI32107.1 aminotransferase class I/II-fold pyridoxal phosphate-dependent enzyme [Nocardia stercoris]
MSPAAVGTVHALGLNENPFQPLQSVRDALAAALPHANRYPEFLPDRLHRSIARHTGFGADQIVVGPGATGVVMYILQEFVAPGERVVTATPTFDGYPLMTATVGGESVRVPLTANGYQDLPAMAAAIDARTRVVVLCTPHNPTGTCIARAELDRLLGAVPDRVIVVLDEAYVEFAGAADRPDVHDVLRRHPNVVVLRTFSKAYGLAALRIGYGIAAPALAARIGRWQLPFGINSLADVAVTASYAAESELAQRIELITRERDHLGTALRAQGFAVPASSANFLFIQCGDEETVRLTTALHRSGIVVKSYDGAGVRITVADRSASEAVMRLLAGWES